MAVVTGGARGIGRGIALVLGEAGATVYVTDRESRARKHSELPGTVEDTAEQLTERGGHGIPVALDHREDDYDLAMHATSRLAHSLAHDLRPCGVTALAVSPGFTSTEAIVAALGERPPGTDSVEYPGRGVRALLADPAVERHAGRTLTVSELAAEYGFVDPEAGVEGVPEG